MKKQLAFLKYQEFALQELDLVDVEDAEMLKLVTLLLRGEVDYQFLQNATGIKFLKQKKIIEKD